jgi:uncharacterized cupredoxin-like copper-binding protein
MIGSAQETGAVRMTIRERQCRRVAALFLFLCVLGCAATKEPIAPRSEASAPSSSIDWARSDLIDVAMTEFDYRPDRLSLREGQPYTLHFVSTGWVAHDFTAPGFFRSVTFRETEAARRVQDSGGTLALAAGESVDLHLVPLQAGTFPVQCTRPLHSIFGMTGEIDVR